MASAPIMKPEPEWQISRDNCQSGSRSYNGVPYGERMMLPIQLLTMESRIIGSVSWLHERCVAITEPSAASAHRLPLHKRNPPDIRRILLLNLVRYGPAGEVDSCIRGAVLFQHHYVDCMSLQVWFMSVMRAMLECTIPAKMFVWATLSALSIITFSFQN